MKYFSPLLLFILNFLPVIELLTFSLVVSLSIYLINKKTIASKYVFSNLTTWLLNSQASLHTLLLSWMLASKIMSLLPYLIHTSTINLSPKLSIIWPMSRAQKPNCSLLGVVLIRPQAIMVFQKSSSSLTQSTLLKKFSILHPILTKSTHHSSSKNFELSSYVIRRIQSNFGSTLAIAIGHFTKLLIRKWNLSTPFLSSLAKHHVISAKEANATTLQISRKWLSKYQTSRENTSLIFSIVTTTSSNYLTSKIGLG